LNGQTGGWAHKERSLGRKRPKRVGRGESMVRGQAPETSPSHQNRPQSGGWSVKLLGKKPGDAKNREKRWTCRGGEQRIRLPFRRRTLNRKVIDPSRSAYWSGKSADLEQTGLSRRGPQHESSPDLKKEAETERVYRSITSRSVGRFPKHQRNHCTLRGFRRCMYQA